MSLLNSLNDIVRESKDELCSDMDAHQGGYGFYRREHVECGYKREADIAKTEVSRDSGLGNILAKGDNLDFMKHLIHERSMAGKLDLIYIDPPFFSNMNYKARIKVKEKGCAKAVTKRHEAYSDTWQDGEREYLAMLTKRLIYMRELLSDTGCIFIHLDWHIVHYVKVVADEIFGSDNFINEIIWQYKSGGAGKRHFGRKHDTILFYAKSKKYAFYPKREKSYNRSMKPYRFKGVKEYKDDTGWYTMVYMKDVWSVDMVGRTSRERVDYATQKPEALLSRIMESCTKEGDICADFFAGSGTLASVADKLSRRWICCDRGELAVSKIHKRLCLRQGGYDYYEQNDKVAGQGDMPAPKRDIDKIKIITRLQDGEVSDTMMLEVNIEAEDEHILDFWSIDYDFDGIHKPEFHYLKKDDVILTCAQKTKSEAFGKVSVKLADIWGNVRYEVIDISID